MLRGDVVKDDFRSYAVFCGAGFVSVTNDGRKSSGRNRQTTWARRTSERRSLSSHQSENGGRSDIIETSEVRASRHMDSVTHHKWPPTSRTCGSSEEEFVRTPPWWIAR